MDDNLGKGRANLRGTGRRLAYKRKDGSYGTTNEPRKDAKSKALEGKKPKKTCGHSDMAQTSKGCIDCEKGRRFM